MACFFLFTTNKLILQLWKNDLIAFVLYHAVWCIDAASLVTLTCCLPSWSVLHNAVRGSCDDFIKKLPSFQMQSQLFINCQCYCVQFQFVINCSPFCHLTIMNWSCYTNNCWTKIKCRGEILVMKPWIVKSCPNFNAYQFKRTFETILGSPNIIWFECITWSNFYTSSFHLDWKKDFCILFTLRDFNKYPPFKAQISCQRCHCHAKYLCRAIITTHINILARVMARQLLGLIILFHC